MDILCVGMYRACSTWQYEVAAHLLERNQGSQRLGYVTGEEYARLPVNKDSRQTWRVLKCHEGHPAFRLALTQGRALALYAIRDPRDVVYSMLHKRHLSFETFLAQGMIHQIVANDQEWTNRVTGPRLDQRYELIIADAATAVLQIADFLRFELSREDATRIAAEYSFEANKRRTQQTAENLKAAGLDLANPTNAIVQDDTTLLHWNHMRQGQVGGWRDRVTPSERYVMARLLNRWISDHAYTPEHADELRSRLTASVRMRLDAKMAWGAVRCTLRCLALYHPRTGRIAKQMLGLQPRDVATPVSAIVGPHQAAIRKPDHAPQR